MPLLDGGTYNGGALKQKLDQVVVEDEGYGRDSDRGRKTLVIGA